MASAKPVIHGPDHAVFDNGDGTYSDAGADPIRGLAGALNTAAASPPTPTLPRFLWAQAVGDVDTTLDGDNALEAGGPWLATAKWTIQTNDRTGSVESLDSDHATWTGSVFEVVGGSGANPNALRLLKNAPPGVVLWYMSGQITSSASPIAADPFAYAVGLYGGSTIGDLELPGDRITQATFGDDAYGAPLRKGIGSSPNRYVAWGRGSVLAYGTGVAGTHWTILPDFVQSSGQTCSVEITFAAFHLTDWA